MLIKKGSKKALLAIGHKIIKATYHILKNKEGYKEPLLQIEKTKERNKQKNVQKFVTQLAVLGFSVRLTQQLKDKYKLVVFTRPIKSVIKIEH